MKSSIRSRNFLRDRRSVAGLEFALVITPMLFLLAGVYDLSQAAIVYAELTNAADTMVASASSLAVQSNGSTALTYQQVQEVESSIWAFVPSMRNGKPTGNPVGVTMTSVLFFPNLANSCVFGQATPCQFVADIAWSVAYQGGDSGATFQTTNIPPPSYCTAQNTQPSINQVNAGTSLNGAQNYELYRTLNISTLQSTFQNTAPANAQNEAGVAPILAVTIEYTYTPLFTLFLLRPITFWVDGYWPVRSVSSSIGARTVTLGSNTVTIEPLASQFTTINAASLSSAPNTAYCINTSLSSPGATS